MRFFLIPQGGAVHGPFWPVVPGGTGGTWHPHFFADQLTLSQPRGADYAQQIILGLGPPEFQTFQQPCYEPISNVLLIRKEET